VIARASEQIAKTLYSTKASAERPFLATVEDEAAQARYVADSVLDHREDGIALRRQAVLFRTAHHSDPIEIELGRRNIPFVKYGGLKFLEAEEGQAARPASAPHCGHSPSGGAEGRRSLHQRSHGCVFRTRRGRSPRRRAKLSTEPRHMPLLVHQASSFRAWWTMR
jgi:superfamily I DNA/RNA helicase